MALYLPGQAGVPPRSWREAIEKARLAVGLTANPGKYTALACALIHEAELFDVDVENKVGRQAVINSALKVHEERHCVKWPSVRLEAYKIITNDAAIGVLQTPGLQDVDGSATLAVELAPKVCAVVELPIDASADDINQALVRAQATKKFLHPVIVTWAVLAVKWLANERVGSTA